MVPCSILVIVEFNLSGSKIICRQIILLGIDLSQNVSRSYKMFSLSSVCSKPYSNIELFPRQQLSSCTTPCPGFEAH